MQSTAQLLRLPASQLLLLLYLPARYQLLLPLLLLTGEFGG
jgi:hypothetical protein